ncbi:hypothetical protein Q3G72_001528 [Acer saccharum]|nr:hypothetical protein Q3G72_001528 [Acer saccharum]
MLRSSSTPVIGSLLSPVSDSPNRDLETTINTKLSFSQGLHHLNLTPPSCCSSPISQFSRETNSSRLKGFRKSRSDGYLEGLAYSSCDSEAFRNSNTQHKSSNKKYKSMLRSALSFSIYNSVDEIEDEEIIGQVLERGEATERTVSIGECMDGTGSGNFSFKKKNMGLIEEENEDNEAGLNLNGIQSLSIEEEFEQHSPSMYLATGLGKGIDGFDGGEVVDFTTLNFDESENVEEYYKRMVDEYPCHPLFLRNYAKLLQSKGDLHGAENYYHSAILADPGDSEILLQYAKLVWELHHDQDRASSYFERAAQAAPQNSNVHAAYASFLWEIEDDGEDNIAQQKHVEFEKEDPHNLDKSVPEIVSESFSPSLDIAAGLKIDMASFTAADADSDGNVENYLRRMVEENPSNPLVLRNYAQFLCQSKGDLHGAEEYYSRAILADPADGEIILQYAKLVWELHHDRDKALGYFERAVQASPTDSHVLGAYASFLWEAEEDEEEDDARQDHFQVPLLHGVATTASV